MYEVEVIDFITEAVMYISGIDEISISFLDASIDATEKTWFIVNRALGQALDSLEKAKEILDDNRRSAAPKIQQEIIKALESVRDEKKLQFLYKVVKDMAEK